jgi:hypothetical protein
MSNQPYQKTLHFLNTHVHILNHTPVQHSCKDIPSPSFLLQGPSQVSRDRHEGGARRAGGPRDSLTFGVD